MARVKQIVLMTLNTEIRGGFNRDEKNIPNNVNK